MRAGCDSNTSSIYLFLFDGDQQLWMVRILWTSERMAFKWMKLRIKKLAARETIWWTYFCFGQLSGACANFWSHIWRKKNSNFFWTLNCKHAFQLKPLPKCCMPCHTCICIARDRVHRFPFNCCFVPFRNFCCALHKHTAHELMWKHKQAKMQQQRRHEKKTDDIRMLTAKSMHENKILSLKRVCVWLYQREGTK